MTFWRPLQKYVFADQPAGVQRSFRSEVSPPVETEGREHEGVLLEPRLEPRQVLEDEEQGEAQRRRREQRRRFTPKPRRADEKCAKRPKSRYSAEYRRGDRPKRGAKGMFESTLTASERAAPLLSTPEQRPTLAR